MYLYYHKINKQANHKTTLSAGATPALAGGAKEANKFKTRLSTRLVRTVACGGFLSAVRPDRFFLYTTAYQPPSFKTCLLPQPRADQGLVGTDEYLIVST